MNEPESPTSAVPGAGVVCAVCGRQTPEPDTFQLAGARYCALCKSQILQQLAAGKLPASPESTRPHRIIHGLAMVSLFVVATMSIRGSMRLGHAEPPETKFGSLLVGLVLWSFLLWKLWKKPRKWGLGLGIFLFLMIAFQIWLWSLAIHDHKLAILDADRSVVRFAVLDEIPIFIASVSCTLLRFYAPHVSPQPLQKDRASAREVLNRDG
jgi:hypothetical protein